MYIVNAVHCQQVVYSWVKPTLIHNDHTRLLGGVMKRR